MQKEETEKRLKCSHKQEVSSSNLFGPPLKYYCGPAGGKISKTRGVSQLIYSSGVPQWRITDIGAYCSNKKERRKRSNVTNKIHHKLMYTSKSPLRIHIWTSRNFNFLMNSLDFFKNKGTYYLTTFFFKSTNFNFI